MDWIRGIDLGVLNFIQEHIKAPWLDPVMIFFTRMGDGGFLWILAGLPLLLGKRYRRDSILYYGTLILSGILCSGVMKPVFERVRPFGINADIVVLIPKPVDFSFPSGHAMSSFAVAAVLFMIDRKFGVPAFFAAALIAFSRLYLYVHYPTDVLAGVILGILLAFVCGKGWNRYWRKKRETGDREKGAV